LLVATHHVWQPHGLAAASIVPPVKVLDGPKTVAPELQVIRVDSRPVVAEIKRPLAGVRRTRVTVGHEHLGQGEAVEQAATIVTDVVQCEPLAVVETDVERPLLPR